MGVALVERVHDLAVDVELTLLVRGVADAHGRRPFVAGEPGDLELFEASSSVDAVHDLQLRRVARDRAKEPLAPIARFFVEAVVEEERSVNVASRTQP